MARNQPNEMQPDANQGERGRARAGRSESPSAGRSQERGTEGASPHQAGTSGAQSQSSGSGGTQSGGTQQGRPAQMGVRQAEVPERVGRGSVLSSPFSFMRRFTEEMDRLFDDFWSGGAQGRPGLSLFRERDGGYGAWTPQIEMFEREGRLVVRADLPGLKREDVRVELDGDVLRLAGERRQEVEEGERGSSFYRSERRYGSFQRTLQLPEGIDPEQVQARFADGVLEITAPMPRPQSRVRPIEIQSK